MEGQSKAKLTDIEEPFVNLSLLSIYLSKYPFPLLARYTFPSIPACNLGCSQMMPAEGWLVGRQPLFVLLIWLSLLLLDEWLPAVEPKTWFLCPISLYMAQWVACSKTYYIT